MAYFTLVWVENSATFYAITTLNKRKEKKRITGNLITLIRPFKHELEELFLTLLHTYTRSEGHYKQDTAERKCY